MQKHNKFNIVYDFKKFLNETEHLFEIIILSFFIIYLLSHLKFIVALILIVPLILFFLYIATRIIDSFGGLYFVFDSVLKIILAVIIYLFMCNLIAVIADSINTSILHLKPACHYDKRMYDDDYIPGAPF